MGPVGAGPEVHILEGAAHKGPQLPVGRRRRRAVPLRRSAGVPARSAPGAQRVQAHAFGRARERVRAAVGGGDGRHGHAREGAALEVVRDAGVQGMAGRVFGYFHEMICGPLHLSKVDFRCFKQSGS